MSVITQPNGDFGAQYIAHTTTGDSAIHSHPVIGWGNAGEGWPDLTPVISTPDGPQALPFDLSRKYSYGSTRADAVGNLRRKLTTATPPGGDADPR